jgi:hypothetical protein
MWYCKESSRLVGEVEDEISKRQSLVNELQQDADCYQKLVSINREQVEAVAQLLQGELRKEGRKRLGSGLEICITSRLCKHLFAKFKTRPIDGPLTC